MKKRTLWAAVALLVAYPLSPAQAIITSDADGTHVLQDDVPLNVAGLVGPPVSGPPLDHDSVGQLFFDHQTVGNGTFCSSALINTSQGPAALLAAHCIANGSGQVVASNFSMTLIDSFGSPVNLVSTDPSDVKIHPNYDGKAWHGYDLALVLLDGNFAFLKKYSVYDGSFLATGKPIIKLGFGRKGYGAVGQTGLDGEKRWGMNEYEAEGLGIFGVELPVSGGWANTNVQLTLDFDDGTFVDHNLFNFYGHFVQPPGLEICNGVQSCGFFGNEVVGAPGDSGGPNFVLDPGTGEWVILAVNSYVFTVGPEGLNGTIGNSDINPAVGFTWGEYEGDALVTEDLIQQTLGLAPPPASSKPFGFSPGGTNVVGGALGPHPGSSEGSRESF